jgi:hypothetical protein
MKLWLLEPNLKRKTKDEKDPWNSCNGWGCYNGYVIKANTEERAREIADNHSFSSDGKENGNYGALTSNCIWCNKELVTCTEIFMDDKEELLLSSFKEG